MPIGRRWWATALTVAGLLTLCAQSLPAKSKPRPGGTGRESLDPDQYVDKEGKVVRRVWTTTKLKRWLEAASSRFEALPTDANPESHEGRMRSALGLRIEMFKELLSTRESAGGVGTAQEALEQERERIERELELLQKAAEPKAPEAVDRMELEAQEKRLASARQHLAEAERHARERETQLEALPQERIVAEERLNKARQALLELPSRAQASKTQAEKDYAGLLLKNARLEHRLAEEHLLWLEREQGLLEDGKELDRQRILRLQLELARVEQEVALYRKAHGVRLEEKRREVQEEVIRKQEAFEQAASPQEKLLARWQARLAQEQAKLLELEQAKGRWAEIVEDRERRLKAETKELEGLTEFTDRAGGGRSAGLRLKMTYGRIRERRAALGQAAAPDQEELMDRFRGQQLEAQEQLQHLDDDWNQQVDAVLQTLPESVRGAFRSTAVTAREQVRKALLERRDLLDTVTGLGDRLEVLGVERTETLDALEELVLSRVFWIRDARPLGGPVFALVAGEVERQVAWLGQAASDLFTGRLTAGRSIPTLLLWGALLLILVPALLVFVQLRLNRRVRVRTEGPEGEPACQEQTWRQRGWTLGLAALAALPVPAYGLLLGWWVSAAGPGAGVDAVLSRFLVTFSVLLFVFFFARSLLGRRCLATALLDMNPEAAAVLYRFTCWVLAAYLLLMLPSAVWERPPFAFEALPRLAYTVFYLLALVALWPLLRKRSPLVENLTGGRADSPWFRAWTVVATTIMMLFAGILIMDVLGYRFGAARMARSAVLSLGTLFLLAALYRLALKALERFAANRARDTSGAPGEESEERDAVRDERLRRFLRTAFVVLGLVLIAVYWGVGAGALEKLTVISFQNAAGELEAVSVGDLLVGLVILAATIWIVRNLKGILDVFVFPRLTIAQGTRYALLTITRWTLFVVGILLTLSAVRLDLGRIGWLVAAMGVGIGFGLQEIIANMVSGVILLIERPVRVGDFLTVGEISGEVRRINIRATTILNFDRQEVIVPNKDFITKDVTNWTLADRVMRLVIPIGVAYGTDVDIVRDMLIRIAKDQPEVRARPAPVAYFMDHGESSLDFQLFVYLSRPEDRHVVRDRINTLINKGLAELGIEIPFPQRDLHVRSGELPVRLDKPGV